MAEYKCKWSKKEGVDIRVFNEREHKVNEGIRRRIRLLRRKHINRTYAHVHVHVIALLSTMPACYSDALHCTSYVFIGIYVHTFTCAMDVNIFLISNRCGYLQVVRFLVDVRRCDVNFTDASVWTPLHHACR